MLEEITKIGEINSLNDLLEFKLSIQTIFILLVIWGICAAIFVIFIFGGVNNTIDYTTNLFESTKKTIIINKDKNVGRNNDIKNED